MKRLLFRLLLTSISGFAFYFSAVSQNSNDILAKNTDNGITFDSLAQKIEQIHQIKLYFNPQWFIGKKFDPTISNLTIEDCMYRIKKITDLNYVVVDKNNYIIVPNKVRNYSSNKNNEGVIIVGDEKELGKLKSAVISGKITNAKTNLPLKNATVFAGGDNLYAKTDVNGNYELKLPTGDYHLKITHPDFEDINRSVKIIENGILNFEFFDKSKTLSEVVVYSKAPTTNVVGTQMSAIQMGVNELKVLPTFLGGKDVIKSMTLLPGVQSTGEFGTGFFVRGGSSDQNLILIEGVPLFNSAHLFGLTSVLNSADVSNASLLKAGIPAKYGERVSSILDIKLKNKAEKLNLSGGIGLLDSRLSLITPLFNKKATFLIGARTSYSNWLLHAMPDIDLKNSSAQFYDINSLLSFKLNQKNNITLFGYFSNDKFGFDKTTHYQYSNTLVSVQYNHFYNDKLFSTLSAGYSDYNSNIVENDSAQIQNAYKLNIKTDYYSAKWNNNWSPNKKHSVDFGVNEVFYLLQPGRLSPYNDASSILNKNINQEKGLESALYINDNLSFSDKISANIGLRATNYTYLGKNDILQFETNAPRSSSTIIDTLHFSNNEVINNYFSLEPRLSFRYSIDKASSVKLSYNRISQFINLISNTMIMSPTDVYKLSSPNVKPLISNQYAVGYFRNFKNNAIESSVELYYKSLKNLIEYRNGTSIVMNDALDMDLINADGFSYGAEIYVKKNTGALKGWMSYTFSKSLRHTTSSFEIDQINSNKYYASPSDIPHNFILNANYSLTRRWSVSALFNYKTGKPVTLPELSYTYNGMQYVYYSDRNKYRLPDYHRLDLSITYDESLRKNQKWKGSWTLSILNVYAQKNPYSVFYKYNEQKGTQFNRSFGLYNLYIIKYPIPTITYNFTIL